MPWPRFILAVVSGTLLVSAGVGGRSGPKTRHSAALIALHRFRGEDCRCRRCGYILHGISEPRCPECGERI